MLFNTTVNAFFDGKRVSRLVRKPNIVELTGVSGSFTIGDTIGYLSGTSTFVKTGEVIDIYAIPSTSQKSISEPELITSGITVAEASTKNNSGKALVVVNLPEDLVMRTLAFISESRLIIVRSNF